MITELLSLNDLLGLESSCDKTQSFFFWVILISIVNRNLIMTINQTTCRYTYVSILPYQS